MHGLHSPFRSTRGPAPPRRVGGGLGRGRAQAYARLFTQDASYVTWFGANLAGPPAIDAAHGPLFAGPMRDSHLSWSGAPDIRFIRPDVAIIVGQGAVATPRGLEPASTLTLVAVRDEGTW